MNQTAISSYQWYDGQYRPNGFNTSKPDKPVNFIPSVLTRTRSKVIPANPDQCLICGFCFDHYREGKAGLCARCVLKGLPNKIKVIIESEEDGKKVVSYYKPSIIDLLEMEEEQNGKQRRVKRNTRKVTRSNDRKRSGSIFRYVKRTDRQPS